MVLLLRRDAAPQLNPDIPNVPLIGDFVKSEESRKLIQVAIYDYGATARPYVVPPKTPNDRVRLLRTGLANTFTDLDFLGDTKKARLDLAPIRGEELEKTVARIFKLEPPLVEKLKEILK
jgi:hypothetical protein